MPEKIKNFTKKNTFRTWFQAAFFALTNGYLSGFARGRIYTGKTKALCVPGLNCYSCPGALYSCPIGSLQSVLTGPGFKLSCYVFGFLMAFGAVFGRLVCGWMCPFGLVQDLLYKIPLFRKIKNLPGHKYFNWLRFIVLAVLVLILPAAVRNFVGIGEPWFCEYLCPSGTLLAGIPLISANAELRSVIGALFSWKMAVLIIIVLLSIKCYRPFCKYLCPLGAIYGLFNPVSFYRIKIDNDKCIQCGECSRACNMGIDVLKNPNSMECIRCGECMRACPKEAIIGTFKSSQGEQTGKRRTIVPVVLITAAVILIAIGIFNGEVKTVIRKSTNICMQCIGLDSGSAFQKPAEAAPRGWTINCVTSEGSPVAGVRLQICSDTACSMIETDENGTVVFDGKEKSYELQLYKCPQGYEPVGPVPDNITADNKNIVITFKK